MRPRALFLLTVACTMLPLSAAPQAHAQDVRLPVDGRVRTGTLANGLQYYVRENSLPANRAELRLAVNVGSIVEDDTQRGLAHFVEHMAFNGTRNFPKAELVNYLESIGMRFGSHLNAYTSFDETVYMLTVPTDTSAYLEQGFRILGDWAHAVSFDTTEVRKERGVVIEEWRLGQGAGERMRAQIFPVLFGGSRYAERLPIGTRESLESFAYDDLLAFYRTWYRPDLMAIVAVGDFDADGVEALIRKHIGAVPAVPPGEVRSTYTVPPADSTRVVIARDAEATNTIVEVYRLQPAREGGSAEAYRAGLIESLYNAMLNARFAELAQTAAPPFIGAASQAGGIVRPHDAYVLAALVADTGVVRGLDALLTEATRVARHGFTATELDRAKADLLRAYEQAFAERDKTNSASYANEYTSHFLEGEPSPGIAYEYELVQRMLPAVTVAEVNRVAGTWLDEPGRTIVVQMPERTALEAPSAAALREVAARVEARDIAAYTDDVGAEELLATLPAPGRVVDTRTLDRIDVVEWTLSNGVRVLVKSTDFKDDQILFRAVSPGGTSLAPLDDLVSASFATAAVQTMGVGTLSATQLQKALAGTAASATPFIGETSEGIQGAASPRDLEKALQLAHLYFTAPRIDSIAFGSIRERLHAALANQKASPQSAFQDTLALTMTQHHPRTLIVDTTMLADWSLDTSLDFYRDRFADADDFSFTFVGNIDLATLQPLVERYLGSLPPRDGDEAPRDHGVRPPERVVEKVVHKGVEPQARTQIAFTGPFDFTAVNRHLLRTLGDVLEIRLRDELREELGGTYGVSIGTDYAHAPWEHYGLVLQFGAAPESIDTLAVAALAEIRRLQQEGPSAELLARVQEMQRRELEESLRQNAYWLTNLSARTLTGEPPISPERQRALIDQLSVQSVQEAARVYLPLERYVRVSLLPAAASH